MTDTKTMPELHSYWHILTQNLAKVIFPLNTIHLTKGSLFHGAEESNFALRNNRNSEHSVHQGRKFKNTAIFKPYSARHASTFKPKESTDLQTITTNKRYKHCTETFSQLLLEETRLSNGELVLLCLDY